MELNAIYIGGFMGGYEWILIIIAIVLLFGGRKIPELMKGLGQGMKEFKNARNESQNDKAERDINSDDKK
ncbi:Sec-independent protein translocase subunit TatA/TatB [Saccharicrinis fermentans]|uniref:Sec-independent protein translocase protein TatA n=1 Tax=Saccharicrinis fermentans DSM 9555 = JCM 21142 TaxID=869213 RepID=W7XWV0_9BACT|nr:twin-arginine translocase TatA/TatE family subunit [Saccharicrinis fermentans]GAF02860.1 twin arginine translocase protein A [Saccharicrinis fermentans DSM 9555 = JCM 21142]